MGVHDARDTVPEWVLFIRGSYCLGVYIRGPLFSDKQAHKNGDEVQNIDSCIEQQAKFASWTCSGWLVWGSEEKRFRFTCAGCPDGKHASFTTHI